MSSSVNEGQHLTSLTVWPAVVGCGGGVGEQLVAALAQALSTLARPAVFSAPPSASLALPPAAWSHLEQLSPEEQAALALRHSSWRCWRRRWSC